MVIPVIKFNRPAEPEAFDARCRKRGAKWLAKNTGKRPPDYWSDFRRDLSAGFGGLCGYCAMHVPAGLEEVDHYVGVREDSSLAYEWDNYRSSQALMNKFKGHKKAAELRVLDPFEVEDDWFELLLPSLQLVLTDRIPENRRERAEFTLQRLRLRDDERLIRQRQSWLEAYESGEMSIRLLERWAPLIARAVRKREGTDSPRDSRRKVT